MPPDSTKTERITLLVFKDGYAARAFQVSLAWLTRFGVLIGVLAALTLGTSFFAMKYYRLSRQGDPLRVQDLENELAEMKASYKTLELRAATTATAPVLPAPQVTVTATAPPVVPAAVPQTAAQTAATPAVSDATRPMPPLADAGRPLLFTALPAKVLAPSADASKVAIQIGTPKVFWQGKTLRVGFDIQYVRPDKGNQQGRIVIIARGPETLLAYPDGVLNPSTADSLVSPDQGEYFSVSRFREVRAEFGPLRSPELLKEVEILLFDNSSQILIHQTVAPQAATHVRSSAPGKPPGTGADSSGGETPNSSSATSGSSGADENQQGITPGFDQ
jgi:hypothetical protein